MTEQVLWWVVGLVATVSGALISALLARLHQVERRLGLLESQVAGLAARQEIFAREREQQRRLP